MIAYHLYNFAASKAGNIVTLIRKSRWHPQHYTEWSINRLFPFQTHLTEFFVVNCMTDLDFNPSGEIAATIDRIGTCLISDVTTDSYSFHLSMKMKVFMGNQNLYNSLLYLNLLISF